MSKSKFEHLAAAHQKIEAAGLMYELNRLYFAISADAIVNYIDKHVKEFDVYIAAIMVMKYFTTCLVESGKLLSYDEQNALYGECIMNVTEFVKRNTEVLNKKEKKKQ